MIRARAISPLIGALGLWLPLAAGAEGASDAALARAAAFVEMTRANGCTLTEAEAGRLLPAAGLTMDDAQEAAILLNAGALFTMSEDRVTLTLAPGLCAADAQATAALLEAAVAAGPAVQFLPLQDRIDPAAGARLIGALRDNGCAMTEDQAGAILPGLGFDQAGVQDIAGLLLAVEFASFEGDTLALAPWICESPAGDDAAQIALALEALAGIESAALAGDAPPGLPSVRGAIGLVAMGQGCVIDTSDPPATRAVLLGHLLVRFDLSDPPDETLAAISGHIDTALANPGPAWTQETGRLRLNSCMP